MLLCGLWVEGLANSVSPRFCLCALFRISFVDCAFVCESVELDSESVLGSVRLDSKPFLDSVFSLHSALGLPEILGFLKSTPTKSANLPKNP